MCIGGGQGIALALEISRGCRTQHEADSHSLESVITSSTSTPRRPLRAKSGPSTFSSMEEADRLSGRA
jgi:hypothetical protein